MTWPWLRKHANCLIATIVCVERYIKRQLIRLLEGLTQLRLELDTMQDMDSIMTPDLTWKHLSLIAGSHCSPRSTIKLDALHAVSKRMKEYRKCTITSFSHVLRCTTLGLPRLPNLNYLASSFTV